MNKSLILLSVGVLGFTAGAETIHVPGDAPTIQAGINAASAGDEVVVADGIWEGPGNFDLDTGGRAITVRSAGGPGKCLIDCGGDGRGFLVRSGEGPQTRIEGFSITGAYGAEGGGFYIDGSSPTIASCWVDSSFAGSGGGLFCRGGSPELSGCEFVYNIASPGFGAGVCLIDSEAVIVDCEMSGNEGSGLGGGVYVEGGTLLMASARTEFNLANQGAGLYGSGAAVTMFNCTVRGNSGGVSSGIETTAGRLAMVGCGITGNGDYGGGVRMTGTDARLYNCTITDNHEDRDQGRGGGVRISSGSRAVLASCTISGNTVGYDFSGRGGGVSIASDASGALIDCRVEGNYAFDHFYSGGEGGGVYIAGAASLVGCSIRSNGAVSGGGVWASGAPVIESCVLEANNAAYFGGGVLAKNGAVFRRCAFLNNRAWLVQPVGRGGGGAYAQGAAVFDACLFDSNLSDGSAGGGADGGGALWSDGAATVANCVFTGNSDIGLGCGGAVVTSGPDRLVNCVLSGNSVVGGEAGAIYAKSAGATVTNTIIRNNGPAALVGEMFVSYSDVEGGADGPGNFDADPLFIDPLSRDFRAGAGSPCIDAGDSGAVPQGVESDFAGAERIADDPGSPDRGPGAGPMVDVGAHEFPATVDPCQTELLLAPDGAQGDEFRYAAFGPGVMAVGAFSADTNGADSGAVYMYRREGPHGWTLETKLVAPGVGPGDFFGARVCLDGELLIASAGRNDLQGENSGAAHIYRLEDGAWVYESVLLPDDPQPLSQFGYAVSISGDRALCGAWKHDVQDVYNSGAAYIFRREGQSWVQEARLEASDPVEYGSLGWAVDLKGDVALVAAVDANEKRGLGYIFRRVGDQWVQEARLEAPDGAPGDKFAYSVALREGRAVLGAPWHDGAAEDAGAAYVYDREPGGWVLKATLTGSLGTPGALAGVSVAVDGDLVAVGAQGVDESEGAAAIFRSVGDAWVELSHLRGDGAGPGDYFGKPVAFGEGFLASGAPLHDGPGGANQGAVFMFNMEGCPCPADLNADGEVDLFDFLEFVNLFVAEDAGSDCDGSGDLDLFDFLCYQNQFAAGCS